MATELLIERQGLVVTKLPQLPTKTWRIPINAGSNYDRCCVPPIQFDFKRGVMRTLRGLYVTAGKGRVSYMEGTDNISRVLGIYRNPDENTVKMVYRPLDGSAVEAKEFESLGIRFRVLYTEKGIENLE